MSNDISNLQEDKAAGPNSPNYIPQDDHITFLLPNTRYLLDSGRVLVLMQRIFINNSNPSEKNEIWIQFEAWIAPDIISVAVKIPGADSEWFKLEDKCPGINDTIKYTIGQTITSNGTIQHNDFQELYASSMFPDGGDYANAIIKATEAKIFFDKYENAFRQLFNFLLFTNPKNELSVDEKNYIGANIQLFLFGFLLRQKTMGDTLRLVDIAYINEILWFSSNIRFSKKGIAFLGTCDSYSSCKVYASNNGPVIYSYSWYRLFTLYSSFVIDETIKLAAIAVALEAKHNNQKANIHNQITKLTEL